MWQPLRLSGSPQRGTSGYVSDEEMEQVRKRENDSTIWPEDLPKCCKRCSVSGMADQLTLSMRLNRKDGTSKLVAIRERTLEKAAIYVLYTDPMHD